jgi:hypothetical protein
MYTRFVLGQVYLPRRQRMGIFRAGNEIKLPKPCRAHYREDCDWFNRELPAPPKKAFSSDRGICWFKPAAVRFIRRLQSLAVVYRSHGIRVWQVYNRDPGLLTWEDEHQIVAVPRRCLR